MAKKSKGELPSGSVRRLVYNGMKQKTDKNGQPVFDKNGKPVMIRDYISVTAENSKAADRAKAEVIVKQKGKKRQRHMTLSEAIDKYIESSDAILSPTTIAGYRTIQQYGFRSIIDTNIYDLTTEKLREAVNIESKRPAARKKTPISAKTVANEYGLITAVLHSYYKDLDTEITLPQKSKQFHELSQPDEIFRIVQGTTIELPVLLSMWLSFSMSEIKGLTKSGSISADGNYITIKNVVVTVNGKEVWKEVAKEEKRQRIHRLPPYIKQLINRVETDVLVPDTAATIARQFDKLLKKNGLPHMSFHDLRHVNASVMALLRIPDKYAQDRGGWATDQVMKGTYMQTFSQERIAVDDTIDAYFMEQLFHTSQPFGQKYKLFLALFDLADSDAVRSSYAKLEHLLRDKSILDIIDMQHDLQHENEKAP